MYPRPQCIRAVQVSWQIQRQVIDGLYDIINIIDLLDKEMADTFTVTRRQHASGVRRSHSASWTRRLPMMQASLRGCRLDHPYTTTTLCSIKAPAMQEQERKLTTASGRPYVENDNT